MINKSHFFDVEIAAKFGVDEAIILQHFAFWIAKNEANKKHYHDGKYWTYSSTQALTVLFPYWSEKQLRRILKSLVDKGLLIKSTYNQKAYDRTSWYALGDQIGKCIRPNGQMDVTKRANGYDQKGQPIPDIITDNKTDIGTPAGDTPKSFKSFSKEDFYADVKGYDSKYPKPLLKQFFEYWTEPDAKGKMRFQLQKTWSTSGRLATWAKNEPKFGKQIPKPTTNTNGYLPGPWN